ncbi:hypothetical protein Zmor_014617 [Zophobas morio]|uniref:PHD-type domain-containing protein n=1 Tax=Zophobas morio TaxID=2755281 RepID=A0AA38IF14_9CUCU|nr:hypothetical protein Zmor_014617 [Zophobas morio]
MFTCVNCGIGDKNKTGLINCDACQGYLHLSCLGLSENEAKLTRSKSKAIKVVCNTCNANISQFKDMKALMTSFEAQFTTTINQLKENLQEQINELKNKASLVTPEKMEFEDIVQEFTERQKRKVNIIVYGHAESTSAINKEQRIEAENAEVKSILLTIKPDLQLTNSQVRRLGKYVETNTHPRPIRITLNNEEDVIGILRNARVLKSHDQFKHISLSSDRTPRQLAYYKTLKQQLFIRTANGEKNLSLKYQNGIPKIISNLN